ncbi:UNVERIFIED_CONTAM: hypothetical protein NCL1_05125 [Trichonephila clavipes]
MAQTSSRWCGVIVSRGKFQLRCRPRLLTMVQICEERRQSPEYCVILTYTLQTHHLRFDIFELQETKLLVLLINTTNERRLAQGHETLLKVKGDTEDVSSELDKRGYRLHFLDERSRIILLS